MKLALAFLFVISCSAFAAGSDDLSVRAERSLETGIEQEALVFGAQEARLVANSNFLSSPSDHAELGLWTTTDPNFMKNRALLDRALAEADHEKKDTRYRSPHRIRLFVGKTEIDPRGKQGAELMRLLEGARKATRWKSKDVALIHKSGDRFFARIGSEENEVGCVLQDSVRFCRVTRYGAAYLRIN